MEAQQKRPQSVQLNFTPQNPRQAQEAEAIRALAMMQNQQAMTPSHLGNNDILVAGSQ